MPTTRIFQRRDDGNRRSPLKEMTDMLVWKKKTCKHVLVLVLILVLCYLALPLERFATSGKEHEYETISAAEPGNPWAAQEAPRVAVCLVGEARQLELTGPTIRKHVLGVLGNKADVFLNVPLDKDSYKLFLLAGASNVSLSAARIFRPSEIYEPRMYKKLLNPSNSPRARQGLLQYFDLVERCWQMISDNERRRGIRYDWIIKGRLDSFWTGSIPVSYAKGAYTVPRGTDFGGVNDRLGVGERNTSRACLIRSSILPFLYEQGYRRLNSERAFEKQLRLQNVDVAREAFPFCILSHRSFPWPPPADRAPVVSIGSHGPLNGAYCRPCTPKASRRRADAIMGWLNRGDGWFPTQGVDLELCDGSREAWEESWESIFDAAAGEEAARIRKEVGDMTLSECTSNVSAFQQQWQIWDGPSAAEICRVNYASSS